MTFIASVIAKKGVAIIADSLVTSTNRIIEYDNFLDFFESKTKGTSVKEIKIDPKDILALFERKPSHTKDYEEKLFKYDNYIAITTAGSATINNKRLAVIVNEMIAKNKKDKGYPGKKIETKIKEFAAQLNKEIAEHLNTYEEIGHTTFIFTHFVKTKETTIVYKLEVLPNSKEFNKGAHFNGTKYKLMPDFHRVVCDGQNRISERILFGELDFFLDIAPILIHKVIEKLAVNRAELPPDFIVDILNDAKSYLPMQFFDDMKINKLADLSLQQAVDLAALLMKIEVNFQKYTENIPTVGGVVKLAVIDKEGFRFISGNEILKPENFT